MLRFLRVISIALLLLSGLAKAQEAYREVEPNDFKAQALANGPVLLGHGEWITGVSTGYVESATNPGTLQSMDMFLIQTRPLPPGIYRHRITVNSAVLTHGLYIYATFAHAPTQQVLTQYVRVIEPGSVMNYVQWYGFGRSERIFVSVNGYQTQTFVTDQPYFLQLTTEEIAPHEFTTDFSPGQIEIASFSGVDDEVHVFDEQFVEIPDYQNNNPTSSSNPLPRTPYGSCRLWRQYAPGVYYIAIGRAELVSTHPPSGSSPGPTLFYPYSFGGEDRSFPALIMDYPDVMITAALSPASPVNLRVRDEQGHSQVATGSIEIFGIAWFRFEIPGGPACTEPSIVSSPASLEVCNGNSASFALSATGSEPLSYQWYWNGSPIPVGGNASTLTIPNVDSSYAGSYTCTVTNACGNATTTPATLTVHPAGPEITGHPESLLLCVGDTATFIVGATGRMHGGLEYQWIKDGLPIAGANAATLSFPVGGLFAEGTYLCRVTEPGCGSSDSSPAILTVRNEAPVIMLLGEAAVTLECGHGSYVELGATVSDDCDQGLQVTIGGDTVDPHRQGLYIVTYDAMDSLGNPAVRVERHVVVVDTTPPVLTTSLATNVLWSPRHEMVNVGLAVEATDGCSPQAAAENVHVQVYCDEIELPDTGDGTGRHSPDAKDVAAGSLRLRSERRGWDDGRIYVIVISTHDAAGNTAYAFETVVCPNAQNQTALDGVRATALNVTAQLVAIANATESAADIDLTLTSLGFRRHGLEAENGPHQ